MQTFKQISVVREALRLNLLPFYSPKNSGSDGSNQQSVRRKLPSSRLFKMLNFFQVSFLFCDFNYTQAQNGP